MQYGCIGEKLKHSFSKEIHNMLADYDYCLKEIPLNAFDDFMQKKEFCAINVTIPYKQAVIPYLDYVDEYAKNIGAVNTVVNKNGKLFGYNTDFFGLKSLILNSKINVSNKTVAVLGNGGTSKTAKAVLKDLGAKEVLTVSRNPVKDCIGYDTLYSDYKNVSVIVNTTPLGMYPNSDTLPVNVKAFFELEGVVDVVYNPLRTELVSQALSCGIKACGGLYMLVAQAVKASEYFTGRKHNDGAVIEDVYKKLFRKKENIVLIGMPSCGKSTIGKIVAKRLGKKFEDTDLLIEKETGKSVKRIFEDSGENYFRKIECDVIEKISKQTESVIATGGGAVLNKRNIESLKRNGKIFFIDRPLECLIATEDRPLSKDKSAIERLYNERYAIYSSSCDKHIKSEGSIEDAVNSIIGEQK